jgi:hypothetical protein
MENLSKAKAVEKLFAHFFLFKGAEKSKRFSTEKIQIKTLNNGSDKNIADDVFFRENAKYFDFFCSPPSEMPCRLHTEARPFESEISIF